VLDSEVRFGAQAEAHLVLTVRRLHSRRLDMLLEPLPRFLGPDSREMIVDMMSVSQRLHLSPELLAMTVKNRLSQPAKRLYEQAGFAIRRSLAQLCVQPVALLALLRLP
jgi:hypothetical protein